MKCIHETEKVPAVLIAERIIYVRMPRFTGNIHVACVV